MKCRSCGANLAPSRNAQQFVNRHHVCGACFEKTRGQIEYSSPSGGQGRQWFSSLDEAEREQILQELAQRGCQVIRIIEPELKL